MIDGGNRRGGARRGGDGAPAPARRSDARRRSPFAHDFLFNLRQALPVLLAGIVLFAVLVPVSTSVVDSVSVFNINYTHDQLKYQFDAPGLGLAVNMACVVYGAVLAVVLFRFLFVKRATTAFFSVGLSRTALFLSRYAAGALCVAVGVGVPFAASFALNCAALGMYEGMAHEFLYILCGYLMVALASFSIAGIAVACAGTLFETCAFSTALLASVTIILWGAGVLADHLLAGKAPVLSLFSVAIFGFAACAVAVMLLGSVDMTVALAVGAALFVLVSLVLLFGPLRGRTSRKVTVGCVGGELAALAVAVGVIAGGGFGYAGYIPDADQVDSVEISYNGSPSYLTQGFSGTSGGSSYYYTSYRSYSEPSSIDIVRSLHGQLIDTARAPRATDYADFQSSVVPYDVVIRYRMKDGGETVRYFDQATVGELSAMLSLDNDEHTHELENAVITGSTEGLSEDEKAALDDSPSYNAYRSGYIYLADGALNRIMQVKCTDEERAALLDALARDLAGMDASERYQPDKPARAALMFTLSPELDVASFGYSFSNAVTYLTEDWTATMSWLEGKGLLDALGGELNPRIIEKLTFQRDDPYSSINEVTSPVSRYFMAYRTEVSGSYWITQDYGSLNVIEDQGEIAEILPNLRMGCYMTGGYFVEAKLSGIEAYVYFYLPDELAPDDL